MAEPVKTQVLKAVETMLGEIPEIKTVYRWQDIPTDLEELENGAPALFFWEEEEKEPWNRLTLGKLDFWMAVFIKLEGEINASLVNGKLPCAVAFKIAEKLQINSRQVGDMANKLNIKIASCQLGCFP